MTSPFLLGVNLAGAEFGTNVPGVFGTDYIYPTHAEIDYYASKGLNVIRLPFLWERLQRTELGPLDDAELARLDDIVNYAAGKGLKIEIEPHNYGYGFGALIGSAQTPNSSFADLWGKLAFHYKSNPDVIFGLMNEPHDQSATVWLSSANAAIAAIRSAGAMQEILVPGSYWDGAWTWTTTDNATVVGTGVQDPAHNFAFEVHQYLDADGSGRHPGVVSTTIGVERVTPITQWAEATGNHLFLGEVGVSTDQTSLTALDSMLTYIQQHTNVWQGVTYWAGGPWWGNYKFSIEPQNGVDKPQISILVQHLTPEPVTPLSLTDASKVSGPQIMYALTGRTEASAAQFDFHAQYADQTIAFYTNVLHSSAPDLGPYEVLSLALWNDANFQSNFASLSQSAFVLKAYTTVFGATLGQEYANTDTWGLVQAINNLEKLYNTAQNVYSNPHQTALAVAFGDLIGIGNEVHSQLSQEAAHYVSLLGVGSAGYNADLILF